MAEQKLDFNGLEARGLYFQQQMVLQAAAEFDKAKMQLDGLERASAKLLEGRLLPPGTTIRTIRIDQATDTVYATIPDVPDAGAPPKE